MKWVTREKARVDRIACPWLISWFIDKEPTFLFVPANQVKEVVEREGAIPFDIPGVELGHHGERCSFDAFLEKYKLDDPALRALAPIVRGADTDARLLTPESSGLYALATGFQVMAKDDHESMAKQFPAYEPLYAYCRSKVKWPRRVPSRGRMKMKHIATAFRLAAILVTLTVACQRSSPEVVVYTSEDQVFSEPILKDFEKSSGIKVRAVYDTEETKSTGVALRIVAERDHPQADVFWANEPLRPVMLQQQGLLKAYRSPTADDIPARYRDPEGYWTGFAARARVIIYNTNLVKPEEAPGSVMDLANPRWKGKAGLANPLFGTMTTQIAALVALWGDAATARFLDAVKANGVELVTSNGEAKDLVVSGELAWAFTDSDDASAALQQHKPIAVVYPDQRGVGTLVMPNAVALVKGAPHPEPAKKLIDYLLSREVEEKLAKSTAAQMPLHSNVTVPPGVKPVSAIKDMAVTFATIGKTIDQVLPYLKRWTGAA